MSVCHIALRGGSLTTEHCHKILHAVEVFSIFKKGVEI